MMMTVGLYRNFLVIALRHDGPKQPASLANNNTSQWAIAAGNREVQ